MRTPVVGIGASAGGLEALSELVEALPRPCGAALIIVQHLDRTHESLLAPILQRKTSLPVSEAGDGMVLAPDHIYVIPPNVTLTVAQGRIRLTPRQEGRVPHRPVDALLRSLAEECGDAAVGVVLSGADSDGALGIQAVKHAGGVTFAQQPETARVPSMPRSAIETDCVDFVLPPAQIATELARLAAHPYLQAAAAPAGETEEVEAADRTEEQSLSRIFRRLRATHLVDFSRYKPSTLRRRLARRMMLHRIESLSDYTGFLEEDVAETAALYQDFLIRVTGFFRDPDSFAGLRERVFPALCASRSPKEPIRIWVPGCATGEEVYSIAIELIEFIGEPFPPHGVQIFGTDVSEAAIEKARAGLYLDSIAQDVSPERLERYFIRQDSHYCIARNIRDLCVFARQDVTRDPPFSRLDLVSCRNLLIYLGPAIQQRIMQIFHYALRPHGFLMLGPAESVGHTSELFDLMDKPNRIYTRKPGVTGLGASVPYVGRNLSISANSSESGGERAQDFLQGDSALRQADGLLLARYAPAGILVDESLTILQFRGEIGPYLAPASGPPSLNLQRVLRPELLAEVAGAIRDARENGNAARRPALKVDGVGDVVLEVIPLPQQGSTPAYLILFEDVSRHVSTRRARQLQSAATESEKDQRLAQLERENAGLREFLQATMEQHEAAREELKSANEEVLSANEEFQSTNEELETSKEELQSANEELTTTNDELRDRNRQLGALNAELEKARKASERARTYADGIIETVREPLLVLDGSFHVLRANHAFYSDFHFLSAPIEGRSIFEIAGNQWTEGLRGKLAGVLSQGLPFADFEVGFIHSSDSPRVLSLSGRKISGDAERTELILLAIEDITERRANADLLLQASRRKDEFLAMLAHELRNPLGPIAHAVLLLKRGSVDSQKLYAMIERQTVRLVRLVDELLDVARISRGLIELKRAPADLSVIVRQALEAGRARADERRHSLTLALPEQPVCVDGDAVRLEQVVSNLLENAIKYTDPGGQISVSMREEGGEAVLSIADNGIGLMADAAENIFELFTQVDRSLDRSGGGLGLGLTVVRRVLEMHGGRIEARSEGLGKGSEFVVRLPLLPSSRALETVDEAKPHDTSSLSRRRALIVDDNVDAAESLALLVSSWGHEVRVAYEATSALGGFADFKPDVALLDIGLPGINGYDLARSLRAARNGSPLQLVAMTGYGRAEDRAAARDAGFDLHLVKPADPDDLERLLAKSG